MKRDWLVKITVDNSGLEFGDDVDFIRLTTDGTVTKFDIVNTFVKTDTHLRKEDEDGHCEYNDIGWNTSAFLDEVCRDRDWTWEFVAPEIDFTI